jgi:phosphohistidine phosphatase
MRRLMLLRHAKTERAEPGQRDRDRKLVKRGRSDAETIASYMADHDLIPDLALVSTARRTQETWDLIASGLGKAPRHIDEDRIYNASTDGLMTLIGETRAARSLLVIGHNPGLHEVAMQLTASGDVATRERLAQNLPTSGLVVIDFAFDAWTTLHPRSGRLEHFITPRLLDDADCG